MAGGARGIQSIEVAGRILYALVGRAEPMMLKDLAQDADLAPAQCHAYLASLRQVGLVQQRPDSGLYQLGPLAMRLGIGWLRGEALAAGAVRASKSLTAETGMMSLVAIWGVQGPTIVHLNEGLNPTALNLRQGTLYSVSGTATGRVFAAFGDSAVVDPVVERELDDSLTGLALGSRLTRAAFEMLVGKVRADGYSVAEGAPIPGVNAISVPIYDPDHRFAMVLSLVGPQAELPVDAGSLPLRKLKEASAAITHDIVTSIEGVG